MIPAKYWEVDLATFGDNKYFGFCISVEEYGKRPSNGRILRLGVNDSAKEIADRLRAYADYLEYRYSEEMP